MCRPRDADRIAREMLRHTTTFGVRRTDCPRYALSAAAERIETEKGVFIRKTGTGYGLTKSKPEYESLAAAARARNAALEEIREEYGNR